MSEWEEGGGGGRAREGNREKNKSIAYEGVGLTMLGQRSVLPYQRHLSLSLRVRWLPIVRGHGRGPKSYVQTGLQHGTHLVGAGVEPVDFEVARQEDTCLSSLVGKGC